MIKSIVHRTVNAIQSLFLYGASGLVALGCYLNARMDVKTSIYPLLWLAGGLFIYNLDRLVPDPSDAINHPGRRQFGRLRKWLIGISAAILVIVPASRQNWILLALILIALVISSCYSIRAPGFPARIKDVPALKWFIPPVVIIVTLTTPGWISAPLTTRFFHLWPLFAVIFIGLLINILLFDLRDRVGDTSAGLKTMANRMSQRRFFCLLVSLLILQAVFVGLDPRPELVGFTCYLGLLISMASTQRASGFYHWVVDGMLFLPGAINYLAKHSF